MMVFASVDLPEPLGPIRAWTSPRSTFRSTPRRISLPSTVTCRFWISRSAISYGSLLLCSGGGGGPHTRAGTAARGAGPVGRDRAALGEQRELGQRRLLQGALDAAVHAGPEQLGRTALIAVRLVVAQHPAVTEVAHAGHRHDPFAE